jgi:signal transduction histidine kinase
MVGIVGSTDDVTELKKLQRNLEEALEAAQAASRSKSTFLANMSHELRTPLNVIIGLTDLMLEEEGLSAYVRSNLQSVGNAGGTLLSIVNDILDISKIESGKLTLIPVEYHTPSLISDTIILLKTYIGDKPIDFKLHISEDLPEVLYGDELRVKQIMNNLLSNAVKYTSEGTVDLSMECERAGNDVWMEISVKDTGKGIRGEDLKNLFTDYYQADAMANRKTEGTGLGLSITRRMVQMMDGKISVDSEYGKGSTFRVRVRQGFVSDEKIGAAVAEKLSNFSYDNTKHQTSSKLVRAN